MEERYLSKIVMDLYLERINEKTGKREVLFLLRKDTGYLDGYYDLPGGHLEAGEDIFDGMIREAKEEVGIDIKRENMEIIHVYHKYKKQMLKFVFKVNEYEGIPINAELNQSEKIEWLELDNLPENIGSSIKQELDNIKNGLFYGIEN